VLWVVLAIVCSLAAGAEAERRYAARAGINGLTVAHAFGLDLRFAAASIAWTTGVAVTAATALTLAF
jgi:hypothetical protein